MKRKKVACYPKKCNLRTGQHNKLLLIPILTKIFMTVKSIIREAIVGKYIYKDEYLKIVDVELVPIYGNSFYLVVTTENNRSHTFGSEEELLLIEEKEVLEHYKDKVKVYETSFPDECSEAIFYYNLNRKRHEVI